MTAKLQKLSTIANECRIDILEMIARAQSGHPGGALSAIDILVALYFHEIKFNPLDFDTPHWEDRDRVVLSKGHAVPALYSVLAKCGAIDKEELLTLRKLNSRLQGHPDRVQLPFIEASTGSLGQGISIAQGIAMGQKLLKKTSRVFCLIGDGESQEGQIWETAMSAPKFELDNLVVILDNNNGQIDGHVSDVMNIEPIADKWRAFRWEVQAIDGHDFTQIVGALEKARARAGKPHFILAKTTKGKGVSFMENNINWHGVAPNAEELAKALKEVKEKLHS